MARLKWCSPLDESGEGFADWIRELRARHASGVYLIRDARTREMLYIGESHTSRVRREAREVPMT